MDSIDTKNIFSVTAPLKKPEKKRWIAYKKTICLLILVGLSFLGNIASVVHFVFSNTKASENNGNIIEHLGLT